MEAQKFLLGAGVALAGSLGLFFARSQYEREQLSVERTVIESPKLTKDCTAVFLSDLHNHEFGVQNKRLIAAIDEAEPDLILIGGDMMLSKEGADVRVPLSLIRQLSRRYPVCYGNGNHETRMRRERKVYGDLYDRYCAALRDMGVAILENSTQYLPGNLAVTGIDLGEEYYQKFHPHILTKEAVGKLAGEAHKAYFQILLCHSPLYFEACRGWGADLTLAGHYHGGTIRIPFLGGLMTPQFQFFLPWCAGEFEEEGKYMVVSRGLGTHSVNIRFNNKPQVVVLDLKRKTKT